MDALSLLRPPACAQRGRACGAGRGGARKPGLAWRSPGGREWAGALSLLSTPLREAGRGRGNRGGGAKGAGTRVGRPAQRGCEHVGVPEMVGPAHLWNPLSVWKGWGAQMGRAHANGGANEGGR